MLKYAFAVFLSAFLLFQIQPIIAKIILPWFGGASSVWTICLVFFQVFLLIGYLYAHLLTKLRTVQLQAAVHAVLVIGATIGFLPIEASLSGMPQSDSSPQAGIIFLLLTTIGLPYALISSSGPLFQSWFQNTFPSGDTYRLYALSNVGSLLGLLSYPLLVEPSLDLRWQTSLWSAGFVAYSIVCLVCWYALRTSASGLQTSLRAEVVSDSVSITDLLLWAGLAATASILLLSTTNQITQDIASVPFLWILPLSLYLISFIICFDKPAWYTRKIWIPLLILATGAALVAVLKGSSATFWYQILAYTGVLFVGCMVCHGELYRKKPHPHYLTKFYLTISTGGALGGFFVALVAPRVFDGYWELQVVWVLMFVLVGLCLFSSVEIKSRAFDLGAQVAWTLLCVVLSFMLYAEIQNRKENNSFQTRGFYGVLTISDLLFDDSNPEAVRQIRILKNGAIIHGSQLRENNTPLFLPTSYYGDQSGVGVAIRNHPYLTAGNGLNVGVVGMGAATIASLCKKCSAMTFFEIDPNVIDIEERFFTNLNVAKEIGLNIDLIVGDGRVSLANAVEKGESYKFDVLAVDAFSGDAIPVHLLTIEAVELYWKNLEKNGILAMHVSNRHLDIVPVIVKIAERLGKQVFSVTNADIDDQAIYGSDWVLMTDNESFLESINLSKVCAQKSIGDFPLWTDQFSNIIRIISKSSLTRAVEGQQFNCY